MDARTEADALGPDSPNVLRGPEAPTWVGRLRAEGHTVHSPVHGPRPHPLVQYAPEPS
jgi:hypothetical protein